MVMASTPPSTKAWAAASTGSTSKCLGGSNSTRTTLPTASVEPTWGRRCGPGPRFFRRRDRDLDHRPSRVQCPDQGRNMLRPGAAAPTHQTHAVSGAIRHT